MSSQIFIIYQSRYFPNHLSLKFLSRLLLLAVIGLGALYLLHVLAQDYMKIQKPAAKLARFLLSKRDLEAVMSKDQTNREVQPFE